MYYTNYRIPIFEALCMHCSAVDNNIRLKTYLPMISKFLNFHF
jgi:hypothetical protein